MNQKSEQSEKKGVIRPSSTPPLSLPSDREVAKQDGDDVQVDSPATKTGDLLDSLKKDGFVVLKGFVPRCCATSSRERLSLELKKVIESGESQRFAKINDRKFRHDLRLHMTDENKSILSTAFGRKHGQQNNNPQYRDVYEKIIGGDASLVEFGVITSHPGAEAQSIHSDVTYDSEARCVYTTFLALQDIDEKMGPTNIWSGTHQALFCEFYKPKMLGSYDPYYSKNKPTLMTLMAGDAVLMDTRVMHCGGANKSKQDRMLFHFSFETTEGENDPDGFTYNLMTELKGKYALKNFL